MKLETMQRRIRDLEKIVKDLEIRLQAVEGIAFPFPKDHLHGKDEQGL